MTEPGVERWAAFTTVPQGGNPAGVVLGSDALSAQDMQRIAAEVGYAETAFVSGAGRERPIRYFSPVAEVPFCGHATVAAAVALADRLGDGDLEFRTPVGPVRISTAQSEGVRVASFTSVEPYVEDVSSDALSAVLSLIGIGHADLDPRHPPRIAFAGNRHPVIVLADQSVFDAFTFDPARARALLDAQAWPATIVVLHALSPDRWEARNIFPVGEITEDPATGAAAAATGAYLRAVGSLTPPQRFVIEQGRHIGRPGLLTVDVPVTGGITVTGSAVRIG
ncbi:PhzF family phenazine biosynthesis protein [Microbacterium sp.]|uniref:PhzF family phenazine biosynthesis protein n=1 Tax=Microbacterium sp. TaxID=51671 RepID=UPI001ACB2C33|nr:PhzF family phenazine biosynthesis protein [Microbacterium sp.]MBN9191125.1 PhzF family phenazine biosynthesis protein [Microbacterium sp.]